MPSTLPAAESSLGALERIAGEGLSAQELLAQATARIHRVVPSDGYFMAATDPETTLCTGTGIIRELPADQCQPHWDYEFLVPDYVKYVDIVRSGQRVADIHDATGGRPDRSPRFKQFSAATGFRSEVRLVFTVGGAAWGLGQLNRVAGRFSDDEKTWLARAAETIGRGLRQAMVAQPATSPALHRGNPHLLKNRLVGGRRCSCPTSATCSCRSTPTASRRACARRTTTESRRSARAFAPATASGC